MDPQNTLTAEFILTDEQRKQYLEEGYIVVKGLLSQENVDLYNQRFADIANGKVARTKIMVLMKDVTIAKTDLQGENHITKLQEFQDDEVMFNYSKEPGILTYVKGLIGEKVLAIHTMFINKPPDTGLGTSVHPSHQDLFYFPHRPVDKLVGVWTAMVPVDKQNGCLYVLPKSHLKGELYAHTYPPGGGIVNKGYFGIHSLTEEEKNNFVYLEMEPGDTIFFHTLLIHGSGPNLSSSPRKACSTHYASKECEIVDVKGTVQEDYANKLEEWATEKLHLPAGTSFRDIWIGKSRRV